MDNLIKLSYTEVSHLEVNDTGRWVAEFYTFRKISIFRNNRQTLFLSVCPNGFVFCMRVKV